MDDIQLLFTDGRVCWLRMQPSMPFECHNGGTCRYAICPGTCFCGWDPASAHPRIGCADGSTFLRNQTRWLDLGGWAGLVSAALLLSLSAVFAVWLCRTLASRRRVSHDRRHEQLLDDTTTTSSSSSHVSASVVGSSSYRAPSNIDSDTSAEHFFFQYLGACRRRTPRGPCTIPRHLPAPPRQDLADATLRDPSWPLGHNYIVMAEGLRRVPEG